MIKRGVIINMQPSFSTFLDIENTLRGNSRLTERIVMDSGANSQLRFMQTLDQIPRIQSMAKNAMNRLIEDLDKEIQTRNVQTIIKNAEAHVYSDFTSKFPFPKQLLVDHLNKAGLPHLVQNTISGKYNENISSIITQ